MPNPKPKPPKVINLASLARVHTETCIRVLAGYVRNKDPKQVPPMVRVTAVGMLLERGWGKAPQAVTGPDGEALEVTIRHIIEDHRGVVIEGEPERLQLNATPASHLGSDGGD
jgi:hypothetical protein